MSIDSSALAALSNEIASTVERVAPSVVAVEARDRVGSSGFYLQPHLIVTADHAIEADDISVVDATGRAVAASLVGRDAATDIALLRSDAPGTLLARAHGDALRVGAIALAVARDDDGDLAASMGVIGAVGAAWRTWHGGEIDRFVRPDLSFYPRFSGSALIDASGALLGMNSGGLSRRQVLTIPMQTLDRIVDALIAGGRVAHGYIGVQLQTVTIGHNGHSHEAAIVLGIAAESPASHAGLIVGDVLTGVDGTPHAIDALHARIGATPVGDTLALDVLRGGTPQRLGVVVGERPEHDDR